MDFDGILYKCRFTVEDRLVLNSAQVQTHSSYEKQLQVSVRKASAHTGRIFVKSDTGSGVARGC